ncbi:hypothetical protein FB45DRAFT_523992 [Roridomyces roridus]|uniref:Protein kinase domain-containing protein n=1 Tax=Roridomyces roridus TaxID=1738132 RepID=A0AAD7BXX5_9AGAR|nr:hypothetical protein FB45DRAFT_523992 [Roridomyces roridus]
MSFIENAQNFALGEGQYTHIRGNVVYNFHGPERKRRRTSTCRIEDLLDMPQQDSEQHTHKRYRGAGQDGLQVIAKKHIKLVLEIGSGPGYLLHAGKVKGRAVIVKVFHRGPTAREQLESTVALSRALFHPNVLQIQGVSSPASLNQYIVYENAHRNTAEGPLAAALKDDLGRSVTLGFKMIAGLSAGMNYLSDQGISLAPLGIENFDVFIDDNDRFSIGIDPPKPASNIYDYFPDDIAQAGDNSACAWRIFDTLCRKVLRSANRMLHPEDIERSPVVLDPSQVRRFGLEMVLSLNADGWTSAGKPTDAPRIPPRREYVWRTLDRRRVHSLSRVSGKINRDMEMGLPIRKFVWTEVDPSSGNGAHRCAGYVREEVTLAARTDDSAVICHGAPSLLEVCAVCHELVSANDRFWCTCGERDPGLRPTIQCQLCRVWSHDDCVETGEPFTCTVCKNAALTRSRFSEFWTSSADLPDGPMPSPDFSFGSADLSAEDDEEDQSQAPNPGRRRVSCPSLMSPRNEDVDVEFGRPRRASIAEGSLRR